MIMSKRPISILTYCLLGVLFIASCSRPVARFAVEDAKRVAPVEVAFKNESEKADTYIWDFGDGNTSEEENPVHRYVQSGNFTVQLLAKKGRKVVKEEKVIQVQAPTDCLVEIQTDYGNMLIRLFDETPQHRDNFLKLADQGFYDDLLFHRVIEGFMIQGGDPQSRDADEDARLGTGGPGYTIEAEMTDQWVHVKGALAAARMGDNMNPEKKSSGSQFYIVHGRPVTDRMLDTTEAQKGKRYSRDQRKQYNEWGGTPFLDHEYTVFGQVIEGMEVIDKIAAVDTNRSDRPREDVKFKVIVIK